MSSQVHPKWFKVDWRYRDRVIAKRLGVTRQRVNQMRQKLGKPPGVWPRTLKERVLELAGTRSAPDIARELGVPKTQVYGVLTDAGVRARPADRRAGMERPELWKYAWDSVDWANETDTEIARRLGCSRPIVTLFRKRRGKPKGPDGRTVAHKARRLLEAAMPLERAERPLEAPRDSRVSRSTSRELAEALMRSR